ncbi:MAG: putative Dynein heavy chain [Streblomastix strix]|uniref:Putative Dynein heavy chain n=1 Tax=Streblomastix strix TaxID=222440 RepID=A0A5J4WG05_9EUKA|nr:MAG: putative Dynein heavy chain [Streblomastix strix]
MGEETEEEKEAHQKNIYDAKLKRKQERQARRQAAIDAGETGSMKSTGSTSEIGGVIPMSSTTAPIPWPSLRYLVGYVMYGGCLTDDWDRINDRVDYVILNESLEPTPVGVVDYIENRIPASATPEVFGLHQNAKISFNTNAAKAMLKNLIDLQPRGGAAPVAQDGTGNEKTSSEDLLQIVANDVQSRIPQKNIDINVVRTQFGVLTPTQVCFIIRTWALEQTM